MQPRDVMIRDLDLRRAAQLVVKRHGDDAPIVAAQPVDGLAREGDREGVAVWRSILRVIEELQRVKSNVGKKVN
jgi:hypothetical protein